MWNDPRTWVAGELVTAGLLNQHVRDNLKAIGDPWAEWVPDFTSESLSAGFSIGNGTWDAAVMQAGRLVICRARLVVGSSTTITGGQIWITLPTPAVAADLTPVGMCTVVDAAGTTTKVRTAVLCNSGEHVRFVDGSAVPLATTGGGGAEAITIDEDATVSFTATYEAA